MLNGHSTTAPVPLHPEENGPAHLQRWRRFELAIWLGFEEDDSPWSWESVDLCELYEYVILHPDAVALEADIDVFGLVIEREWFAGPTDIMGIIDDVRLERIEADERGGARR